MICFSLSNFDDHMAMAMKPVLLAVFLLCLLTNGVTPYPRKIRDFFSARVCYFSKKAYITQTRHNTVSKKA